MMTRCKKSNNPLVICIDAFERVVTWEPMNLELEYPCKFLQCEWIEMFTIQKMPTWRMFLDENASISDKPKTLFAVDGKVFFNRAIIAQWCHETGDWEYIETTVERIMQRIDWLDQKQEGLLSQIYSNYRVTRP